MSASKMQSIMPLGSRALTWQCRWACAVQGPCSCCSLHDMSAAAAAVETAAMGVCGAGKGHARPGALGAVSERLKTALEMAIDRPLSERRALYAYGCDGGGGQGDASGKTANLVHDCECVEWEGLQQIPLAAASTAAVAGRHLAHARGCNTHRTTYQGKGHKRVSEQETTADQSAQAAAPTAAHAAAHAPAHLVATAWAADAATHAAVYAASHAGAHAAPHAAVHTAVLANARAAAEPCAPAQLPQPDLAGWPHFSGDRVIHVARRAPAGCEPVTQRSQQHTQRSRQRTQRSRQHTQRSRQHTKKVTAAYKEGHGSIQRRKHSIDAGF
eukprot:364963-Chlamydomonas_euryale.AAC.11